VRRRRFRPLELGGDLARAVVSFFDDQEAWLVGVLEQGREEGTLRFSGSASEAAQVIVGGLEGAMLVTRPYGDPARFQIAADRLLATFAADSRARVS
jgi:TetR/AcrR family transcriptional repressor of nem operon